MAHQSLRFSGLDEAADIPNNGAQPEENTFKISPTSTHKGNTREISSIPSIPDLCRKKQCQAPMNTRHHTHGNELVPRIFREYQPKSPYLSLPDSHTISRVHLNDNEKEAGYCLFFAENLTRHALEWFAEIGATVADLWNLRHELFKPLQTYINKFRDFKPLLSSGGGGTGSASGGGGVNKVGFSGVAPSDLVFSFVDLQGVVAVVVRETQFWYSLLVFSLVALAKSFIFELEWSVLFFLSSGYLVSCIKTWSNCLRWRRRTSSSVRGRLCFVLSISLLKHDREKRDETERDERLHEEEETGLSLCHRHRYEFVSITTGLSSSSSLRGSYLLVSIRDFLLGFRRISSSSIPLAETKKTEEEDDGSDPELLSHMASIASKLYSDLLLELVFSSEKTT
ncbi:hypothetical protein F2Q69_00036529 [Brassica cretica]|uniref:Uncharacterized protein n=1 Tax=Brassica cretica TaxID=69181 RepID=A0A8S9SQF0_BRACR|nr:hypothetical protein F2Q69_00036529 [Brassica cretica]